MATKSTKQILQTAQEKITQAKNKDELQLVRQNVLDWLKWLHGKNKISSRQLTEALIHIDTLSSKRSSEWGDPGENKVPERNKKNVSSSIVKMLLIVVVIGIVSFAVYTTNKVLNPNLREETPQTPTIPFRGTLKDSDGNPIDTKRDVRFRLYLSEDSADFLYEGTCIGENGITPDYSGQFTVVLGADCGMESIPESLLSHSVLFLGVAVGEVEEVKPRYRIYPSSYIQNSKLLNGKSLGTKENTIPFIDEEGRINLEASGPIIKSTNGIFQIEGASLSLKTTDGGVGNVVFQPAAGANTIIATGNLGVGSFSPTTKLSVVGTEPYSSIASIRNLAVDDVKENNVLDLELGTSDEGVNSAFISFYAGSTRENKGSAVGSVRLNNGGVVYETKGADFAEYFKASKTYNAGTIVSLSRQGIAAARKGEVVVGVVSENAGFVGNSQSRVSDDWILVGMVGQVEVMVTNEYGRIEIGDSVGVGSIPGFGTKIRSTRIGYALEEMQLSKFSNEKCPESFRSMRSETGTPIQCGKILILLKPE